MANPTLPEGWPTGVREHSVRCCSESVLNAAAFAVTAYPALVALVSRWCSEEYADAMMLNEAAVSQADRCAHELAAIIALAKETKE